MTLLARFHRAPNSLGLLVGVAAAWWLWPIVALAQNGANLPPLPPPLNVPQPGPSTGGPYAPQPIVPGGVVVPLYAPDSPELNQARVAEPEQYQYWGPVTLGAIVGIHNPSIEFHPGNGQLNTGAVVILAAGGGHRSLNVGSEAAPFVSFFAHHGVSTVILRNRLRSDGYDPRVHGVNDTLQAIRLVRAYAEQWRVDPAKIGVMGFSAGGELAACASLDWEAFDERVNAADGREDPFRGVSSRPDFVALIYPGPTPFAHGARPPIPRAAPPAFIAGPGWGDWIHAVWATEYFTALLHNGVPNVEMHLYARGHHPGDQVPPDEPPATGGLANMGGLAFGTWSARLLEWMRDLGFLNPPGEPTRAARDVAAQLAREPRRMRPPPSPPASGASPSTPAATSR